MHDIQSNSNLDQPDFDLSLYIKAVMFNIYRIIFIFIAFLTIWFFYYTNATRIYDINSLIQIQEGNKYSSYSGVDDILFGGEDVNLDEQIALYLSYTNLKKLVKYLQLDIYVNDYLQRLPEDKPLQFNKLKYNVPISKSSAIFYLIPSADGSSFDFLDGDKQIIFNNINWDENYSLNQLELNIRKPKELLDEYEIQYVRNENAIEGLRKTFTLQKLINQRSFTQTGSIIKISFLSHDQDLAKQIVRTANNIFFDQDLSIKRQEAKTSLSYLQDQLLKVRRDLDTNEKLLNDFRIDNTSINIEAETLSYVERSNEYTMQLSALNLQLAEANSLYQAGNPLLKRIETQANALKAELDVINKEIETLPESQQEYINLLRNVNVTQTIYETLLERELEFSLIEASTIGNVRIVDEPNVVDKVSPQGFSSLFLTLVLATIFSIAYAIIRTIYFLPIQLPSELQQVIPGSNNIGVIPFSESANELNIFDEPIQSMTTNIMILLENMQSSNQTIMVSGATASIGKTMLANIIAKSLSERGKKVALLDMDFKRGDLERFYESKRLSHYNTEKIFDEIENYKFNDNLYMIPRPKKLASKALSIIDSPSYSKFVSKLKKEFDIVIFDTPPILSVSEAISLNRFSDLNFFVAFHDKTRKKDLISTFKIFNSIDPNSIKYIIYNGFTKPKGYYAYDYYAYKYYSSYDYEYKEDE